MKIVRRILVFAPVLLVACTIGVQPIVMPDAVGRPLSRTAVFSTIHSTGSMDREGVVQITAVDGMSTTCWKVGCPVWVRVEPGRHTFNVILNIYNDGLLSHLNGGMRIRMPDMKAKHVYEANFIVAPDGKSVKAAPIDLGENPHYGFTFRGRYQQVQF